MTSTGQEMTTDGQPTGQGADAPVTLTRAAFDEAVPGGRRGLQDKIASGEFKIERDNGKAGELLSLLNSSDPWFNIVKP